MACKILKLKMSELTVIASIINNHQQEVQRNRSMFTLHASDRWQCIRIIQITMKCVQEEQRKKKSRNN